jgi:hypothetical protein
LFEGASECCFSPSPRRGEGARRAGEGAGQPRQGTHDPLEIPSDSRANSGAGVPARGQQSESPAASSRREPAEKTPIGSTRVQSARGAGPLLTGLLIVGCLWWLAAGGNFQALGRTNTAVSFESHTSTTVPVSCADQVARGEALRSPQVSPGAHHKRAAKWRGEKTRLDLSRERSGVKRGLMLAQNEATAICAGSAAPGEGLRSPQLPPGRQWR